MKDKFIYAVEGKNLGCNFYRIRQPFSFLSEMGDVVCASSSMLDSDEDRSLWTQKASLIFSQIATSSVFMDFIKANMDTKKFVLDYDDNIFCVSPYNPAYRNFGTKEVKVRMSEDSSEEYLWKDGERGFDIDRNLKDLDTFKDIMSRCSVVTTPNPILSGVFMKNGARKVQIIKNFIDLDLWKPIRMEKDEYIRIGYQGGWSHYEDWWVIKDAIAHVMKKYPKVILVFMGQIYKSALKGIDENRIVNEGWVNMDVYPHKFKALNIDIGLAPLEKREFNYCKSEIKWEEYSALEIPCIASNMIPYNMAIKHAETGFLANDTQEWIEYLSMLIESKEKRKEIGLKAKEYIVNNYDIRKGVEMYKKLFEQILLNKTDIISV